METNSTMSLQTTDRSGLDIIRNIPLENIMSKEVITIHDNWSIKQVAQFFIENNISGAPVACPDGKLVGVVSQSDVVRFESRGLTEEEIKKLVQIYYGPYNSEPTGDDLKLLEEKSAEIGTVDLIMTPEVFSVPATISTAEVCEIITNKGIHRLFVTDGPKLIGVVTAMDILKALIPHKEV